MAVNEASPDQTGGEQKPVVPGVGQRKSVRWAIVSVVGVVLLGLVTVLGSRMGVDATVVRSPLLGKPAPAFDLPRLDGGRLTSEDLAGQIYVVNFWASWCVPCREENPHLQAFYERWRPEGVQLVGVLYNDTAENGRAFREELGGDWPLVEDPDGRTALDYGVFGIPETYVISADGTIMAKLVGAVTPGTLEAVVAEVRQGGAPVFQQNDRYRQAPG